MSELEHTGERNSDYSALHRTLGQGFNAIDIDFVEFRWNRGVVAVFGVTGRMKDETHILNCKRFVWERTLVERLILAQVSVALKVPAYYVLHDEGLNVFHVHDLGAGNFLEYKRYDREGYLKFLKEL